MTVELDQTRTLIVALLVLFTGSFLTQRVPFLLRYSIPVPVVGGIVFAALNWGLFSLADVELQFQGGLQAPLMLMFFTSIGLGADLRTLRRGDPRLALFLGIAAVFLVGQNAVGIGAAIAMDLHPLIGLLTGRYGPAPEAMIIVPLVGAFFVDLLNTGVITGYLALPFFGFG